MEVGCNKYNRPSGAMLETYKRVLGKVIPTPAGKHDRLKAYDFLSIVYDEDTLVAYLSTQCVPEGVEITNREYWQPMNVSGYQDDNVITITDRNVSGQLIPYTLATVLPTIAEVARKQGAILTFFSLEGGAHWELWQFFGLDVSDWEDVSQWRSIYNIWNKFVGWYDTTEELYQLHVYPIDGKYAIVGPTIRDAVIYEGTPGGWIPLDINLYQKFLNDFLELVDEGVIILTDCQKDILKKWFKEIGIGCDCDGGNADWGWSGRPYTLFEVKTAFECDSDLKLTYPTSIYHDASNLESVGNPALHSITVDNEDIADLDLKFTAGAWHDITNGEDIYLTDDKDTEGYLDITFDDAPANLQIKIDKDSTKPFTNGYKVPCDGGTHVITIIKPNTVRVQLNYYNSATSMIKTKTIEVPYGSTMEEPVITDATYAGHTFVGWARNYKTSTDQNNYFDVVGRTDETPSYFDFGTELTSDLALYAWYNIEAEFNWTDNGGAKSETRNAAYNAYITDTPEVGELTGYTFQGWQFNGTTIPDGQRVGPITKPVVITGLYQPNIITYNYKVTNNTSYQMQVTIGDQTKTISAGSTVTYTMLVDSAILVITTDVPTGDNLTNNWTINGTNANSKTVTPGDISLGMNTTYHYKVINNSGQPTISVQVGNQTKNVTTNTTYNLPDAHSTATVKTAPPANYGWAINSSESSSLPVDPGNIYITLVDTRNTYDYIVVNNATGYSFRATITTENPSESLTNNVVNHETFTLHASSGTITIDSPAPQGYAWTIDGVTTTSAEVTSGTIQVDLIVLQDPVVTELLGVGFYDATTTWNNPIPNIDFDYPGKENVHNLRVDYKAGLYYDADTVRRDVLKLLASAKPNTLKLSLYVVDDSGTYYDVSDLGTRLAEVPLTFVGGEYYGTGANLTTPDTVSGPTNANTTEVTISGINLIDNARWTTLFSFEMPANVMAALVEGKTIYGSIENNITSSGNREYNGGIFSYEFPDD